MSLYSKLRRNIVLENHVYGVNDLFGNLLIEGRKEDIIKKYGGDNNVNVATINWLSDKDPSGNNKYLKWMVKTWLGLGKPSEDAVTDVQVADIIKLFHKNIQRIENKDINSYSYDELKPVTKEAEEQREKAELKKEAKKQKTIIHEDDRWLVVSPHSHKASCYYGAGTKWCVTMKNSPNHWNRYSKRATFFFIIDKTKDSKDRFYKVAYRRIGSGGKIELWDATDMEFSKNQRGEEYLKDIGGEISEKIVEYHEIKFPKTDGREEWIDNDPKAQALVNYLGHDNVGDVEDYQYGISIYSDEDSGSYYMVGDEEEYEDGVRDALNDKDDDELLEYYDYEGNYLYMYDETSFIDEEVSAVVGDMDQEDFLERALLEDEWKELETEKEEKEELIDELQMEDDLSDSQIEKLGDAEYRVSDIEDEQENLVDRAREEVEDELREEWESCLSVGVVDCFCDEKGWYRNASDLLDSGIVYLDRDDLIDNVIYNHDDYDEITMGYGLEREDDDDGDEFLISEIDY